MPTISYAGFIVVISGLVQVAKTLGLPTKFCPLLAVLLGAVFGELAFVGDFKELLFYGVVAGLSSAGFYDAVKPPVKEVYKKITGR